MGRVRLLDEALANQIAAGEVVERPASVIKELLENAIDAGATAITVELAGGGVERLRVVDNGCGMSREDAVLALQRHATSKLRVVEDLSNIGTLGFRGEALPSIASVSRFSLRTREPEALGAVKVCVEGGAAPVVEEAGGPSGTDIRVEDLFYNVPARRKFLKTPGTEASHVQEAVVRLALCYPEVAFRFVKEGRTSFDLPRHGALMERVRAIFGASTARDLYPVSSQDGPLRLDGLVSAPAAARGTARHYHTFINGRFVRDRVIMSAVQAAYGGRLERRRHPFVVLRLDVPPEIVDVNVHPAKTEVRFVDTRAVHRLVVRAVDAVLREAPWEEPSAATEGPAARSFSLAPAAPESSTGAPESSAQAPAQAPTKAPTAGLDAHRRRIFDVMERIGARRAGGPHPARTVPPPAHARGPEPALCLPSPAPPPPAPPALDAEPPLPHLGNRPDPMSVDLAGLRPLAPLNGLLLCAAADGLVGVDLSAAARRVRYDRLRRGAPGVAVSPPRRVDLERGQVERLAHLREAFDGLGLHLEPFGGATHLIDRSPAGLPVDQAPELALRLLSAAAPEDVPAAEWLAWICSEIVVEPAAPESLADAAALLTALAAVEHRPPRALPTAFCFTERDLRRALRPR